MASFSTLELVFLTVVAVYIGQAQVQASCPHIKYQYFEGHTACKPKSASAVSVEISPEMRQQIVDRHNHHRGNADPPATNMMKMHWDDEIAMIAQKWADACDDRTPGVLTHDSQRFVPGRFSVGQNLGDDHDFIAAIDGWYSEKPLYSYGTPFEEQQTTFHLWLHYTLMMWANSHKIGCGASLCGSHEVFVCNYAPMGNIVPFNEPYKTGTQCADCQTCTDGLCDCGANYRCDIGQPKSDTCGCACSDTGGSPGAFLLQPDCRLNCTAGLQDIWICGTQPWCQKEHCPSFHYDCPWMCNVCPYADPDYVATSDPDGSQESSGRRLHGHASWLLGAGLVLLVARLVW